MRETLVSISNRFLFELREDEVKKFFQRTLRYFEQVQSGADILA